MEVTEIKKEGLHRVLRKPGCLAIIQYSVPPQSPYSRTKPLSLLLNCAPATPFLWKSKAYPCALTILQACSEVDINAYQPSKEAESPDGPSWAGLPDFS